MKLRMYFRGLGLGLIVAALVLSFGTKTENRTMTDAEIRSRAKELGMVDEGTTLKAAEEAVKQDAEAKTEEASKPEETVKAEEITKPEETAESEEGKKSEGNVKSEEEEKTEETAKSAEDVKNADTNVDVKQETKEPEDKKTEEKKVEETKPEEKKSEEKKSEENKSEEKKAPSGKAYTLNIEKGYSSDRVAKILEGAGVVQNAASFDKYLCSNGYDHRISTGTYHIPAGADFAAIAKLITHSN